MATSNASQKRMTIHVSVPTAKGTTKNEVVEIHHQQTHEELRALLCSAAEVNDKRTDLVVKLYRHDGVLVPINAASIQQSSPETRYKLEITSARCLDLSKEVETVLNVIQKTKSPSNDATELRESLLLFKEKLEHASHSALFNRQIVQYPAVQRVESMPSHFPPLHRKQFPSQVLESLKYPTFDLWMYEEDDLLLLIQHMFYEWGLVDAFSIKEHVLDGFLQAIRISYNDNAFHNFRHCFSVVQMCYSICTLTGVLDKLTPLERLILLISCMSHDADHPGFNNMYQINARTLLATVYNDMHPLESHHSAILFTIFRNPNFNILSNLTETDYKQARKSIIACILATDMGKHGEITMAFKNAYEKFDYSDPVHKCLLLQIIVKCSDISNEVRPKKISERWADLLHDEFFHQSDVEKAAGLPYAPFMDRDTVSKPAAQVKFIGGVMLPLYELAAKLLPNMEEPFLKPIRESQAHYQALLDEQESKK